MPFGRYRNRELWELPLSYLEWLTTIELEPMLRHSVETELRRRGQHHYQPRPETTPDHRLPLGPILTSWFAEMSIRFHPDRGGSNEAMAALNVAYARRRLMLGIR
jgi:hypothetical protein